MGFQVMSLGVAIFLVFGCQHVFRVSAQEPTEEELCTSICNYLKNTETINVEDDNKIYCANKCFTSGCVDSCICEYDFFGANREITQHYYQGCITECQKYGRYY